MNKLQKLKQQKEKIEKEIKELENQEKLKLEKNNYEEIKFKNKLFRIYKWENKKFEDIINKDWSCKLDGSFRLVEFNEFNELVEEKKIKLEAWKVYIVKHFNKLQLNKNWCLSRVCLYSGGYLYAGIDNLANSDDYGRVVFVKELKN